MSTDLGEKSEPPPARRRWQFSLRRMFVATTAIAILFSLASWGGWVKSDAVVYLAIAVLAGVFSTVARRALLAACAIWAAFCLAVILGEAIFGPPPDHSDVGPEGLWISAALLVASAASMRMYTRASPWSLVASLVLIEIFAAAVAIHTPGCPTLLQEFSPCYRPRLLGHLQASFLVVEQWFIVVPWLLGIVAGEILVKTKKSGGG